MTGTPAPALFVAPARRRGVDPGRLAVVTQLTFATLIGGVSTIAGSSSPEIVPRGFALLALFSLPAIVGWIGITVRPELVLMQNMQPVFCRRVEQAVPDFRKTVFGPSQPQQFSQAARQRSPKRPRVMPATERPLNHGKFDPRVGESPVHGAVRQEDHRMAALRRIIQQPQ